MNFLIFYTFLVFDYLVWVGGTRRPV